MGSRFKVSGLKFLVSPSVSGFGIQVTGLSIQMGGVGVLISGAGLGVDNLSVLPANMDLVVQAERMIAHAPAHPRNPPSLRIETGKTALHYASKPGKRACDTHRRRGKVRLVRTETEKSCVNYGSKP